MSAVGPGIGTKSQTAGEGFGRMLLKRLAKVFQLALIHRSENEALRRPIEELWHSIAHGKDLRIQLVAQRFFVDGTFVRLNAKMLREAEGLKDVFRKLGVDEMHFDASMNEQDLRQFFTDYQGFATTQKDMTRFKPSLTKIRLINREPGQTVSAKDDASMPPHERLLLSYSKLAVGVEHVSRQLRNFRAPIYVALRQEMQNMWDLMQDQPSLLLGITQRASLKRDLSNYLTNTVCLSLLVAKEINCSRQAARYLGMSALTHDMGRLTLDEFGPDQGVFERDELRNALNKIPFATLECMLNQDLDSEVMHRIICAFETQRSESFLKLKSDSPRLWSSELIAIPAAFCRLTTPLHGQPLTSAQAIGLLVKHSGTHFDPMFLTAFVRVVGLYPVGAPVLLSDGKVGWVEAQAKDSSRLEDPRVRVEPLVHGAERGDCFYPSERGLHVVRALPYRGAIATQDFMLA